MGRTHVIGGCAPILFALSTACGAVVYDNAIQVSNGFASASQAGVGFDEDFYTESAPDPLASWASGDIDISASLPSGVNAGVHSAFTSTMTPSLLAFQGRIYNAHATTPGVGSAEFSYLQNFSVQFHFDVATQVALSASALRQTITGDPAFTQLFLNFGRKDGSPIIDMAYPGDELNWSAAFPKTVMILQPGDYVLQAFTNNFGKAGASSAYHDELTFSMIIPAPGAVAFGVLGVPALRRRRTR